MDEQLKQAATDALTKAVEAATKGAEWLGGQIPEVVQQLLTWHFVAAVLTALMSAVVIGGCVIAAIRCYGMRSEEVWDKGDLPVEGFVGLAGSITVGFLAFLFCVVNSFTALKIAIAPKLYLLEYIAGTAS